MVADDDPTTDDGTATDATADDETDDPTTDDGTATDGSGDRRLVAGWHGRYYEDFAVGDIYRRSRPSASGSYGRRSLP